MKILLVDDKAANLFALEKILGKLDVELFKAQSGNKALELTLWHDFALVLLGVQMPRMNGYDATRALRAKACRTPIVALTAHAMKGDEQRCLEAGCDDYLSKPLKHNKLAQVLRAYTTVVQDALPASDTPDGHWPAQDVADLASLRHKLNVLDMGNVIDWHKLVKTVGEPAFAHELVQDFLVQTAERLGQLVQAVEAGRRDEICALATAIRSSAATVRAEPLSQAALEIRMAAEAGKLESIESLLAEFKIEFTRLQSAFAQAEVG